MLANDCWPKPEEPLLLAGAAKGWGAFGKWSPDYFSATLGETKVGVLISNTGVIRWRPDATPEDPLQQLYIPEVPFREAVDWILQSEDGGPRYYIGQFSIPDRLPSLVEDLEFPQPSGESWLNLWFGSGGNKMPLHYDGTHNVFVQILGTKTFTLYSPSWSDCLYRNPPGTKMAHYSQVDLTRPDHTAFPRLREAQSQSVTLHAGDILILPPRWWHFVVSDTLSISVNQWSTS